VAMGVSGVAHACVGVPNIAKPCGITGHRPFVIGASSPKMLGEAGNQPHSHVTGEAQMTDPIIGHRDFADEARRPIYEDVEGQYVLDDKSERLLHTVSGSRGPCRSPGAAWL
jgi:hypothetical protein